MKKIFKLNNLIPAALIGCMLMAFSSCLKHSDSEIKPTASLPFKGLELSKMLAAQSSLQLFNQAFTRLSLASQLDKNKSYTIFAPTDSAMKVAGLDANTINKMPLDSLRKRIFYHIVTNAVDDAALANLPFSKQMATLLQDTLTGANSSTSIKTYALFVREENALYINGSSVPKNGPVIQASNGYIYPIKSVIPNLPATTLLDIIRKDPDLTMYYQALTLSDSIRDDAVVFIFGQIYTDSEDIYLFGHPTLIDHPNFIPTLLAPTNKAFNDAGFHNINDLRKYALSQYTGYDLNTLSSFYFSPLDSVLKRHEIYNSQVADIGAKSQNVVALFYDDLLSASINNGIYNVYTGPPDNYAFEYPYYVLQFKTPLKFSASSGDAYVAWSPNPSVPPAKILHDAAPVAHPVNSFVTSNGQLYKTDVLFYTPPTK